MIFQLLKNRTHPLLYVTLAYIIGICIPSIPTFYCLLALGSVCLLAIGLSWYYRALSKPLLIIIICSIAVLAGSFRIAQIRTAQSEFFDWAHKSPFDVVARVESIDRVDHVLYDTCITVTCTDTQRHGEPSWQPADITVQIYTKTNSDIRKLCVDDRIGINKLLFKKPTKQDFGDYLIKEGITATLFIMPFNYVPISRPHHSLKRWLHTLKYETVMRIKRKISPRTFQLFASIFLGYKQTSKKLTEKNKDHFTTWGVTHYLARSGLHMVIFVFIWQLLLNVLPIPWIAKELILISLGLSYCILSWPSVSFNRAFLTFLLYKWCTLMRLQTNFLHLLALVCLLILLHNPMQFFFLDFQLSFGLTFALACFNQIQTDHKHQRYSATRSIV